MQILFVYLIIISKFITLIAIPKFYLPIIQYIYVQYQYIKSYLKYSCHLKSQVLSHPTRNRMF